MSAGERAFGLLLRAYPMEFRAAYGEEMRLIFRDQRRAGMGGARFWTECALDVARSAPALRIESWHSRRYTHIQLTERIPMRKTMAILAILIGAVEATNALVEGRAASAAGLDGSSIVAVTLAVVAGVLLLASGIAQSVRSTKAPMLSLSAAITCLAVFTLVGIVLPRMSIFSTILGIGFPIVLLLFLRLGGGQPGRATA